MEFHEISKLNATILDLELRARRGFNREKSDKMILKSGNYQAASLKR